MSDSTTRKFDISLLWKGALFGVANIIPGVSGGTIAVITGVYDEFMNAIAHFLKQWRFLLIYFIGAALGVVGGSFTLESLFEHWPAPTLFCFMGFILGGIPCLLEKGKFKGKGIRSGWVIGFILAFALVILLSFFIDPSETAAITEFSAHTALLLFCGGALASSAMVIPGISGSFLLLLIGLYTTFVGAVTDMNIPMLICIMAGVAAGILLTARILGFFLSRFHQGTYAVILGLVVASIIALWPGIPGGLQIPASVISFAAGLAGGYLLADK